MAEHHAPLGDPLRAGRAYVVLLLRLDEGRTQDARVDADERIDRVSHGNRSALNQPQGDCVNGM
jgi:hypothetical protein